MKKVITLICFLALCVAGVSAQKGSQAVGGHLMYGTDSKAFGIGAIYQYGLTDQLRLEGVLDYDLPKNHASALSLGANIHYLFPVAADVNIYPLAGLGYYHAMISDFEIMGTKIEGDSKGYLYFNIGAGAEFNVTDKLSIPLELKYFHVSSNGQLLPTVGLKFKF